jgi:hypothetical protein
MPTIPNYNLDVDDLTAMDYLTFAKKRMIKDIKTDKSIENADKYISETTFKDTGDYSATINNIKEIYNLWNKSFNLLTEIGNKITKPRNVTDPGVDGNTNLIKEDVLISAEIVDKTNIINSNLVDMIDKLNLILKNPSTIRNIPNTDVEKLYNFFKKWIIKLLGDNPRRWTGILSSQVLRLNFNGATDRFIRRVPPATNDRLRRQTGKPSGFIDIDSINNNFGDILNNWYNFRDIWRVFIKIYNSQPA